MINEKNINFAKQKNNINFCEEEGVSHPLFKKVMELKTVKSCPKKGKY